MYVYENPWNVIKIISRTYFSLIWWHGYSQSTASFLYVSPYPSQQLYCIESLHPPGHPVRAVVLRTAMKETHCNSQYNIALF
jgi:hypothetical protein